jgi:hypothetical protein
MIILLYIMRMGEKIPEKGGNYRDKLKDDDSFQEGR